MCPNSVNLGLFVYSLSTFTPSFSDSFLMSSFTLWEWMDWFGNFSLIQNHLMSESWQLCLCVQMYVSMLMYGCHSASGREKWGRIQSVLFWRSNIYKEVKNTTQLVYIPTKNHTHAVRRTDEKVYQHVYTHSSDQDQVLVKDPTYRRIKRGRGRERETCFFCKSYFWHVDNLLHVMSLPTVYNRVFWSDAPTSFKTVTKMIYLTVLWSATTITEV